MIELTVSSIHIRDHSEGRKAGAKALHGLVGDMLGRWARSNGAPEADIDLQTARWAELFYPSPIKTASQLTEKAVSAYCGFYDEDQFI